ncbi:MULTISPECIES: hypothetical protein [Legionella]|uniref:Uncharacterized protein n=1 Tax=Legionella drozanskii LLAP-1 TaxID=1212489 RepID=A0A0W0SMZ7_9GAMM|nr:MULTISPECIES: hypothetical protein [Legionella]KTC84557.1 hypothetical protein Ldro_2721 [Legionella drozanskii LLAP-1]PJE09569.1 MAG: hypothetical protein CK430_10995 [Legionella sp.]
MSTFSDEMEYYEKYQAEKIKLHKESLLSLNIPYEKLINYAAEATATAEILNETVQYLEAENANLKTKFASNQFPQYQEIITQNTVAAFQFNATEVVNELNVHQKNKRIQNGRKGGETKRNKDSEKKQAAKSSVKEYWDKWQETITLYDTQIAFALDMLEKFPVLTNPNTIESWCREWRKNKNSGIVTK